MASIGEVNATENAIISQSLTEDCPYIIYFGVFFDGTSNNMIQKKAAKSIRDKHKKRKKQSGHNNDKQSDPDLYERELLEEGDMNVRNGANRTVTNGGHDGLEINDKDGYSNIGILHSLYQGLDKSEYPSEKKVLIYNIYIEGAGTKPIGTNAWGSLFGTGESGVAYLVSKALEIAFHRISVINKTIPSSVKDLTEVKFDVYGFSRGATCSRLFAYCIASDQNSLRESDLPCVENLRDSYLSKRFIKGDDISLYNSETIVNRNKVMVDMLGIFDTVSSIGGLTISTYRNNTTDFGLYSPQLRRVKHTYHICAIDEFRSHFAVTNIGSTINGNCGEIYIPGCHSDIGGGYINKTESFKIQYALMSKEYDMLTGEQYDIPIHLQIARSYVSRIDESTNFINYLRDYGFLGEKSNAEESKGLIYFDLDVTRKSEAGYSNIPLEIMIKRSYKDTGRTQFRSHKVLFEVNKAIKSLFEDNGNTMESLTAVYGKRMFHYPGGRWDSSQYRALRKYLHFSAKWYEGHDMYIDNNGSVKRIFYNGDRNDATMHTYEEYNI